MELNSRALSSPQLLGILNTPPKCPRPVAVGLFSNPAVGLNRVGSTGSTSSQPQGSASNLVSKLPLSKQNATLSNISMTSMIPPIADQRPTPILQNVVGTANLCCALDLLNINQRTRNTEYNPQRFSGVVMRIREPRTTSLIFRSGKMVITGAKSESECNLAARKIARIIQKLGYNIKFLDFRVTNIVATCDLKFPIRVENLNMLHGQFSSYEPELFPGLIYRMVHPRVVILIFVNGKLCFTGAKTIDELHLALENIYPILKSFRKQ